MRKFIVAGLFLSVLFFSCNDKGAPDVSAIKVDMKVNRFEKDFFALDTNNVAASLKQLATRYPLFLPDFTMNILGLPPLTDSSTEAFAAVKQFLRDYRPIKDTADKVIGGFDDIEKDIEQGLKYTKHYFPAYKIPETLNTFIGPMDAYFEAPLGGYGDAMTNDGLAVGLQLHLGTHSSFYHSPMGEALYPGYISKKFTRENIAVNCMKNVVDDLYPENLRGKAMVEQMVEKGKRLYVLDKLMPFAPDTLKIGYSKRQLEGCYANEGGIWNFFLTNNMLFNKEPDILKNYLADAPSTQELGPSSPGYIGLFVGWQIVKKYMEKNDKVSLLQLLQTDARKIFDESKYRPK